MDSASSLNSEFAPAQPARAAALATLVYESSHELLDFMFGGRLQAEAALTRLLRKSGGHFGYRFATTMAAGNDIAGVELGYGSRQLAAEELRGTRNMFHAMPLARWPHLVTRVSRALSGYVPRGSGFATAGSDHHNYMKLLRYSAITADISSLISVFGPENRD
jgi:hypothetical protein